MSAQKNSAFVLVVDFGSQFTQLIARRVRELGIYSKVVPHHTVASEIDTPLAIILSGGPESVLEPDAPALDASILKHNVPILGICYGMQILVQTLGGQVSAQNKREYGEAIITLSDEGAKNPLFKDWHQAAKSGTTWFSHGDSVSQLPAGFETLALSENNAIAAIGCAKKQIYALQFHPEVSHTECGTQIISDFLSKVANIPLGSWTMASFIDDAVATIRQKVGSDEVLLALSGGVDSSVAAALIHQAIGPKLKCIFVDNGLLRKDEVAQVRAMMPKDLNLTVVDAQDLFFDALATVEDPEQKRKIIGRLFIEVFTAEAKKFTNIRWLAQGTIYPDIIESAGASKASHNIKSHHNVGGLPENLPFTLLEPLRYLFKDEVRKLGLALGLSDQIVMRHPFPGPGLAVRILGEVRPEFAAILRAADAIFMEELHQHCEDNVSWYRKVSQAFAVFLPIKSVGVMGDSRSYEYVVALRAVCTDNFMTAQWARLPQELLAKISNRITNEVKGINRVVYDISHKPPATIEWE